MKDNSQLNYNEDITGKVIIRCISYTTLDCKDIVQLKNNV